MQQSLNRHFMYFTEMIVKTHHLKKIFMIDIPYYTMPSYLDQYKHLSKYAYIYKTSSYL